MRIGWVEMNELGGWLEMQAKTHFEGILDEKLKFSRKISKLSKNKKKSKKIPEF